MRKVTQRGQHETHDEIILALLFSVLMLANIANAESPREQLKQMVDQLQQSPNDKALPEKIGRTNT